MGRKALLTVLCWITLNETLAKAVKTANGVGLKDNVSAESASRLYRNVPADVYASAIPYASYSFHVPQFVIPKNNQGQLKQEGIVGQSTNNYLKDSYGHRFVEAPQAYAYKAALPQQFVALQTLPAHLSQPLVAAAPSVQYGQATHFFGSSPFKLANLQAYSSGHVNPFGSLPSIYADNVRSLAEAPTLKAQVNNGHPVTLLQSSSSNNVYANNFIDRYNNLRKEPKISASDHKEHQQLRLQKLVNAPKETTITSITNGKKTVVNVITKPPVPLLDLTLLEPLTFDNPLVPQVQHFLPRIHQVRYQKLPELSQIKNHQKVYTVQNSKSYDSTIIKSKPKNKLKKKQKKQSRKKTKKVVKVNNTPTVTVNELHNETPEISYEINSPNYKETYSEKKVSYNKETQSEPVNISYVKETGMKPLHYSYEKHTANMPVHYDFVHISKEPAQLKEAIQNPKHLIYHFKPEQNNSQQADDQEEDPESPESESDETYDETSNESDSEEVRPQQQKQQPQQNIVLHELAEEAPENIYTPPEYQEELSYQNSREELQPDHREKAYYKNYKENNVPEHREEVYYHNPKEVHSEIRQVSPEPIVHKSSTQQERGGEAEKQFEVIRPQYESVKILPKHKPHSASHGEVNNQDSNNELNSHKVPKNGQVHNNYPKQYYSTNGETEQLKRIIIKEESPQEVFIPNDELMAAMVKKQEESEENFEKAYKDAAYGFEAYDAPAGDVEKDVYNPANYGVSRYGSDYHAEKSPLREYAPEHDEYPKRMRSEYKDARDKTNDHYYSEYEVSKPERLIDRYKQKEEYYKNYMDHLPQKYFAKADADKKESAKYVVAANYGYAAPLPKQQLAKYTADIGHYNYAKQAPHDSSAYASRPLKVHSGKLQFAAPQYQYGFGPLKIDSELAAMASNDSPESQTPVTRKKVYKENFFVKKSGTVNGEKVTS